jgi:hypothetical protein
MRLLYGRCVGLAFGVGIAIAALPAISDATTQYYYCGYSTPPRTACQQGSTMHTWNENNATGNGGGNRYLDKCERMHAWDNHADIFSRNCGTGVQQNGYWFDECRCSVDTHNPGYWLEAVVGNNEAYVTQTMYGVASYGL